MMTKDPYKYFRIEARELLDGLKHGALDLEKGHASKEALARVLRFAHTLKGAARVVKVQAVADLAHAVEDLLAPYREVEAIVVSREHVDALLGLLDAIDQGVVAIETRVDAEVLAQPTETVRIEVDDMDALLEGVAEAHTQLGALGREAETLARAHRIASLVVEQLDRSNGETTPAQRNALVQLRADLARLSSNVGASVEQVAAELTQVRDSAYRLRLTPVSTVFATIERAARDAAQSLGKRIEFKATGGDTRLDAHVLGVLSSALVHVVRNAIAHGIESPSQRLAAGKPVVGVVELHASRRGDKVVFACRDDGRGVDVEALRRAARERGVADATTTSHDLFRLMLKGGLTTTTTVTHLSGRGIGLDVVREVLERLKGEARVSSEPRAGTTFELHVPVSLTSRMSLVIRAGNATGSVPLDDVTRSVRITESEIVHEATGDSISFDGNVIPFVPLARLLGDKDSLAPRRTWSAIIVRSGESLAAIGVDRLLGTADVVARRLPAEVEADAILAGTSLGANGNPELVFDAAGLVARAHEKRATSARITKTSAPILVIDDSLTTRMLEQSILESAGYDVEVATSAEEGLEKAKTKRYGVFVVDVEMPGMDGFEFVTRTRADSGLRDVPSILVTSRAAESDRKRGRDAGAHAYIVKGEFDQSYLLDTIRELVR